MEQLDNDGKAVIQTDAVLRHFRFGMTVRQVAQSADSWLGDLKDE